MSRKYIIATLALVIAVGAGSYFYTKSGIKAAQPSPQGAAVSAEEAAAGELWSKRCNEATPPYCEIFQRIIIKESGQRLLEFAIGKPEGASEAQAALILPLGITMTQGVVLKIDDGELHNAAVRTCGDNGCLVMMGFPDSVVDSMKVGKVLAVGFLGSDGKQITVPLSLVGFAEKLATIQ